MSKSKTTEWTKANMSGDGGGCAEFRGLDDGGTQMIQMRNSRDPNGPALTFTQHEVRCLLDGRENGEFMHLLEDLI